MTELVLELSRKFQYLRFSKIFLFICILLLLFSEQTRSILISSSSDAYIAVSSFVGVTLLLFVILEKRNFNLQKVGNIDWLKNNYNFKNISPYIDELIVLDVSRKDRNKAVFLQNVLEISKLCFVPITVGGGIKSLDDAKYYLNNASDKVLINSSFHLEPKLVDEISKVFGEQSIVVGIDLKKINDDYSIYINNGNKKIEKELKETFEKAEVA